MGLLGSILGKGIGLVGGLLSGNSAKKASQKASAEMVAALQGGINALNGNLDYTKGIFQPAISVLNPSIGAMGDLVGINGAPQQQASLDQLQMSPLMASLTRNGEEAVLQNAAATGGIRGGNTQRGLADFRSDTFARLIQQQLANLGGLAGIGMNGAGAMANASGNTASSVASLLGQQGQARAGQSITAGGINAQNWNNLANFGQDVFGSIFQPSSNSIGNRANAQAMSILNSLPQFNPTMNNFSKSF